MAHTLKEYRASPQSVLRSSGARKFPCICGNCGKAYMKRASMIEKLLADPAQKHFYCSRVCRQQHDPVGNTRECRKCHRVTSIDQLWNHRGWTCSLCVTRSPRFLYQNEYHRRAGKKGVPFTLSYEEFLVYWQKPCSYCGTEIATIGLDRVDNAKGYESANVVPCCAHCNALKGTNTQAEFLARCARIAEKHGGCRDARRDSARSVDT